MNKTVKVTGEYVYKKFILDKAPKIVEKISHEYNQKYGENYHRSVKVMCIAKFSDKKNETKNITIERYNIFGELNRIMQWSEGLI